MIFYANNLLAVNDWLKVTKEGDAFKVTADAHWSRTARKGTLIVQTDKGNPTKKQTVFVTQAAAAVVNWAVTTGNNPTTNVGEPGTNPPLAATATQFAAMIQTNGGFLKLGAPKGVTADKIKVSKTLNGTPIAADGDGFYALGYDVPGPVYVMFEIPANGSITTKDFGVTTQAYGNKTDSGHSDVEILWRQSAAAAYITLDPTAINNIAAADNVDKHTVHTVSVQTNAGNITLPGDLATKYPWLSFTVDQSAKTISVFAKTANTATNTRAANVVVTAGSVSATLDVTQLAAGAFLVDVKTTAADYVDATSDVISMKFNTNMRQLKFSGIPAGAALASVVVDGKTIVAAEGVYAVGDGSSITVTATLSVPVNGTVEEKTWQITATENKADSPQSATATNKQKAGAATLTLDPVGDEAHPLTFDADGSVGGASTDKQITVNVSSNTTWTVAVNEA